MTEATSSTELVVAPALHERWGDLVQLFGTRGACGGCWCMYPRTRGQEFTSNKGEGNRAALERLCRGSSAPGLLAYSDGKPIAWCAVGPREQFVRYRKRWSLTEHLTGAPVWAIVCLFIARPARGRGTSTRLIVAARDYALRSGAAAVEAYPVEPRKRMPDTFAWTGIRSVFDQAGFIEVARSSPKQPILRYSPKSR